jgi:hypothetical protein
MQHCLVVFGDGERRNATDATLDFLGKRDRIHSLRLHCHAETEEKATNKLCDQRCRTNISRAVSVSKKKGALIGRASGEPYHPLKKLNQVCDPHARRSLAHRGQRGDADSALTECSPCWRFSFYWRLKGTPRFSDRGSNGKASLNGSQVERRLPPPWSVEHSLKPRSPRAPVSAPFTGGLCIFARGGFEPTFCEIEQC